MLAWHNRLWHWASAVCGILSEVLDGKEVGELAIDADNRQGCCSGLNCAVKVTFTWRLFKISLPTVLSTQFLSQLLTRDDIDQYLKYFFSAVPPSSPRRCRTTAVCPLAEPGSPSIFSKALLLGVPGARGERFTCLGEQVCVCVCVWLHVPTRLALFSPLSRNSFHLDTLGYQRSNPAQRLVYVLFMSSGVGVKPRRGEAPLEGSADEEMKQRWH